MIGMEKNIIGLDLLKTNNFKQIHKNGYLCYEYDCHADGIYGLGERFCGVNHKGKKLVNEVIEKFTEQGEHTYFPIPFYIASDGHGVFVDTACKVEFEFGDHQNRITIQEDEPHRVIFFYGTVKQILASYRRQIGIPTLPPKWAFGVWASANRWNCQQDIEEQMEFFSNNPYPVSVVVIEAWSDEATFYLWNGATYQGKDGSESFCYKDFTFHKPWEDPLRMIHELHQQGIKVILWQIPALKKLDPGQICLQHEKDCDYAKQQGLVAKNTDGSEYRIPKQWFIGAMLPDFYNPKLREWWCGKRAYLLHEMGVDGFKTDGGEFVYDESIIFNKGTTGRTAKNDYPVCYEKTYQEFIGTDRVLFSRAGYHGAEQTPIHWAGDQKSTFAELQAVLGAGLSLAMSGMLFWTFDLAGFAGPMPSKELYLRATELAAVMPVMQWHSESANGQFSEIMKGDLAVNDRSPWNLAKFYHDNEVLMIATFYANLHMNLIPHLYSEAIRAIKENEPLIRPLMYEYEQDTKVTNCQDEFCIGDLLIAPVLKEHEVIRKVYLPEGIWYNIWTGESYQGRTTYMVPVPMDQILLFLKKGGAVPLRFDRQRRIGTYLGNKVDTTDNICILTTGEILDYTYYESQSRKYHYSGEQTNKGCNHPELVTIDEFVHKNGRK